MAPPQGFPALSAGAAYSTFDAKGSEDKDGRILAEDFAVQYRWSDTNITAAPAVVVQPATEDDISALIRHSNTSGLKLIPASGGHGSFVPIDAKTVYLDMRLFNTIELDEDAAEVTMAGGVLAGSVLEFLAGKGWYTTVPNANAVGMAGFMMGGGSSSFNALHGLAIDNLVSARIITADGVSRTLSRASRGKEADLWNVLRGAGYGFGVLTSLTLKTWRIRALDLDNDNLWTRRLVFPPSPAGVRAAADLFVALQGSPRKLVIVLFFARAPPTAPKPCAPMAMLLLTFLGPASEAEKAAAASFAERYAAHALVAETGAGEMLRMNDAAAPMSRHGGLKENYSVWSRALSASQIVAAFESWVGLGGMVPAAKAGSYVVFAAKNPAGMLEHDREGQAFFPRAVRGREVFVQVVPWWSDAGAERGAREWAGQMLKDLYVGDGGEAGEKINGFAANLYKGIEVQSVWPRVKSEEIRRAKGVWDPEEVFWCPVLDGV